MTVELLTGSENLKRPSAEPRGTMRKIGWFVLKLLLAFLGAKIVHVILSEFSPTTAAIIALVTAVTVLLIVQGHQLPTISLSAFVGLMAAASLSSLAVMPSVARAHTLNGWGAAFFAMPLAVHLILGCSRAVRAFRASEKDDRGRLKAALSEVIPHGLARVASAELIIMLNAFRWFSPPDIPYRTRGFTYHKIVSPMMWAFFFIVLIETIVVHLLVRLWSEPIAWVLFVVSDISLLYLLGLICSLRRMPVILSDESVRIKAGILYDFDIPIATIAKASITFPSSDVKLPGTLKTSLIAFPNVMLELSSALPSPKPMGIGGPVWRVAFALDDRDAFITDLRLIAMKSTSS